VLARWFSVVREVGLVITSISLGFMDVYGRYTMIYLYYAILHGGYKPTNIMVDIP